MTLIRILGKVFAKPLYRYFMRPIKHSRETQEKTLFKIIKRNQDTQFGKEHKFRNISSIKEFQKNVIPHSYEYFRPYIDSMTKGAANILVRGNPSYWGKTAGSTGTAKLIPITAQSLRNATNGVLRLYLSYLNENPHQHSQFLDGTICFFHANPILEYINKIPVGFGTGIFSQSTRKQLWSPFLQGSMYSTAHLFGIKDLDKRFRYLTRELTGRNITAFAGVTSFVLSLLDIILKYTQRANPNVNSIKEIFPNCQLAILGGESPKFYEDRLFSLIGKHLDYREVYGATEELIAVQLQAEPGLTPVFDANFLEFCEENSEERLLIHEIKKSVNYKIILTNFNGLYAYSLGDVVKFISTDPPRLVFSHREGTVNMASEKMTVQQISDALLLTNQEHHCGVAEYCVIGKYTPKPHYIFILEYLPKQTPADEKRYLKALNQNMMSINPVYHSQLQVVPAMQNPELLIVKTGTFFTLEQQNLQEGVPMGQHKIQHLSLNAELEKKFVEFLVKKIDLE
ncbi:MAG: GH3 auxin-responsive promoter family protein [Candidatus Helarchaeota archaeon]|nr:GH3 auxin-responsive promoter family protein [Candidatus Helarchaeota archaeon]